MNLSGGVLRRYSSLKECGIRGSQMSFVRCFCLFRLGDRVQGWGYVHFAPNPASGPRSKRSEPPRHLQMPPCSLPEAGLAWRLLDERGPDINNNDADPDIRLIGSKCPTPARTWTGTARGSEVLRLKPPVGGPGVQIRKVPREVGGKWSGGRGSGSGLNPA